MHESGVQAMSARARGVAIAAETESGFGQRRQAQRRGSDDLVATGLAAGLAERLLDEVAQPGHNWRLIGELAGSLMEVAARAS
jgi:hypothetical protein